MKTLVLSCVLLASALASAASAEVKLGEELVSGDLHAIVTKTSMQTWGMFNIIPQGMFIQVWSTDLAKVVTGYAVGINYLDNDGKLRRISGFAEMTPGIRSGRFPQLATYDFCLVLIPIDLATIPGISVTSVEIVEIQSPVVKF